MILHGLRRAFADTHRGFAVGGGNLDATHAGLRGEGDELGVQLVHLARAEVELFLRQDDDAAAFGRLVGERAELRGTGEKILGDAGRGVEGDGHAVAQQRRERHERGEVEEELEPVGRLHGLSLRTPGGER